MRWQAKAAIQNVLSFTPRGAALNYVLQRRVTRSLPFDDRHFTMRLGEAGRHLSMLRRHRPQQELATATFMEFGAGWDLIVPLAYYALGVGRQLVLDITPNAKLELINDAVRRLPQHREVLSSSAGLDVQRLPEPVASVGELARYGIEYLAPADARNTGFAEASVDFVSSTFTLEHIPARDIKEILTESWRILRPGGVISCSIDTLDHYSFGDDSISPYNYLRYSSRAWTLINSGIHYQNRLRAVDHERLFEQSGFTIVEREATLPDETLLKALEGEPVAKRFRGYSPSELAVPEILVVGIRPAR